MRRSKQTEPEPAPRQPSNVNAAVAAPRPVAEAAPVAGAVSAPAVTAPALSAPAVSAPALSAELTGDDLERGRTTAMIASLGRVQLTLDLIERRLGRLEDSVLEIREVLAEERSSGLVPAELPYLDAIDEGLDEPYEAAEGEPAALPHP